MLHPAIPATHQTDICMTCRLWVLLVCLNGVAASPQNYTHTAFKAESVKRHPPRSEFVLMAIYHLSISMLDANSDSIEHRYRYIMYILDTHYKNFLLVLGVLGNKMPPLFVICHTPDTRWQPPSGLVQL
jgi:hypothetical protein